MPYKGDKKREYENSEIQTYNLNMPKYLYTALREKLEEKGGRTLRAFFVDAAAEYCGLTEKIEKRRAPRTRHGTLKSPDGQEYKITNLRQFCRENPDLFPNHEPEKAYWGLSQARKRGGTWFGWTFL